MTRNILVGRNCSNILVAVLEDNQLKALHAENQTQRGIKSNIYKGKVIRIERGLDAAFVNYGSGRNGFLPLKEVSPIYYRDGKRPKSIQDVLSEGQAIMVQVFKEERGQKGAALTTDISIAGSLMVIMPNNPGVAGISRRIEGDHRKEAHRILEHLQVPTDLGLILRTAAIGSQLEDLQNDVAYLTEIWTRIKQSFEQMGPDQVGIIFQEIDPIHCVIRDWLSPKNTSIIAEDEDLYHQIHDYLSQAQSSEVHCLRRHQGRLPLFKHYNVESQIELVFNRVVSLPSGGELIFDQCEALLAIDVNSGKSSRKGSSIEDTALATNLEAAEKIALQVQLQDIGGLIVVDFIDMHSTQHQLAVQKAMKDAFKNDRARVQIGPVSQRFGTLVMSRQRLGSSIMDIYQTTCEHCQGRGFIRSPVVLAQQILHSIEDTLSKKPGSLRVYVPSSIIYFFLNERRHALDEIEQKYQIKIFIFPMSQLSQSKKSNAEFVIESMGRKTSHEDVRLSSRLPVHSTSEFSTESKSEHWTDEMQPHASIHQRPLVSSDETNPRLIIETSTETFETFSSCDADHPSGPPSLGDADKKKRRRRRRSSGKIKQADFPGHEDSTVEFPNTFVNDAGLSASMDEHHVSFSFCPDQTQMSQNNQNEEDADRQPEHVYHERLAYRFQHHNYSDDFQSMGIHQMPMVEPISTHSTDARYSNTQRHSHAQNQKRKQGPRMRRAQRSSADTSIDPMRSYENQPIQHMQHMGGESHHHQTSHPMRESRLFGGHHRHLDRRRSRKSTSLRRSSFDHAPVMDGL